MLYEGADHGSHQAAASKRKERYRSRVHCPPDNGFPLEMIQCVCEGIGLFGAIRQRPSPRLDNPHAGDLDGFAAGGHALCTSRTPCASIIAPVQPSRQEMSGSRARRRAWRAAGG
jgi:hypothetical protein